jgi:hypothetical protein
MTTITKDDILAQLAKNGVTDLDAFADFLVRQASPTDDDGQPLVNDVIIIGHGFCNH